MGFDSETAFEKALVVELQRYGWRGEMLYYPTEEDLIRNWADKLFLNNSGIDCLNDQPLTDGEMQQILDQVEEKKTPLALNGFINGMSVTITRDNPNDTLHFGKAVSLTIYKRSEIAGGGSCYQIARQPKFERHHAVLPDRRADLMLLINGMPLIHIELKSSKVSVGQAANQISKYSHEGVFTGIFALVQIFVAMTPEEMLYFANPGREGTFNRDYYFHWANFNNETVNDWKDLAHDFLSIPMAHQMIGFYTVADQGDGILKVMRSYQYFAANQIRTKVAKIDWTAENQLGGYVWHTTGSGKTLTSFKSAQLIANAGDADKVVFLVDRIELGTQSLQEYRGFSEATEDVQETEDTGILVSKLKSDDINDTLIVTSIQKMSRVNDEQGKRRQTDLERVRKKRIVIIVDECHRSTFGDMLAEIKQTFPRAVFFGFSGTPIQEENRKKLSTTSDIFGNELHRYTIADGIRDKNVLGFDPYMVPTYKDKDLRQVVALERAKAETVEEALNDERKKKVFLRYMSSSQTPMAGHKNPDGSYTRGIEDYIPSSQYNCDKHRQKVVKDIRDQWIVLSQNGKFHALLATSSIPEAIEYYRLMKSEMPYINVTALFDPSIDNDGEHELKEAALVELIEDYNAKFGTKFTIPTFGSMKKNISLRLAHKKPYNKIHDTPEMQIHLLIVVDQMLTGFDSKWLNTLYLDKVLEYEHLIQAFSRTNRLFGTDKPFGTIRYYRYPHTMERNIENAVASYSGNRPTGLFAQPLIQNLKELNHIFSDIRYLFDRAGIKNFERLPDNEAECGRFVKLFRTFCTFLEAAKIQGFRWDKQVYDLPDPASGQAEHIEVIFDETTYLILVVRYKELCSGSGGGGSDNVPYDIDTYLTEIDTGQIDANYMNSRFEKFLKVIQIGNASGEERANVLEELHKSFATLSQEEQYYANIFLHDVESGNVELVSGKSFHDYVVEYLNRDINDRIHRVSELLGLDENKLRTLVNSHVTPSNINEFNRFEELKKSVNRNRAKIYLQTLGENSLSAFAINRKVDEILRDFIINGLMPPIPDFTVAGPSTLDLEIAAETKSKYKEALLVGGYKGVEQLKWIQDNGLYNVRAYTRRGAVKNESKAERATRLLLYDVDNPSIYWCFSLCESVETVDSEKMTELHYPRAKETNHYFLYQIERELVRPSIDVMRLIDRHKTVNWTKGAPIYIDFNGDFNDLPKAGD